LNPFTSLCLLRSLCSWRIKSFLNVLNLKCISENYIPTNFTLTFRYMSVLNYLKCLNKSQYFSSCQLLRICEIFIIYCSDKFKKNIWYTISWSPKKCICNAAWVCQVPSQIIDIIFKQTYRTLQSCKTVSWRLSWEHPTAISWPNKTNTARSKLNFFCYKWHETFAKIGESQQSA